jgi:hypothetical protein
MVVQHLELEWRNKYVVESNGLGELIVMQL